MSKIQNILYLDKKIFTVALCYFFSLFYFSPVFSQSIFTSDAGLVRFTSYAPLELIKCTQNALKGAIDFEKNTFAFSIEMDAFEGFNNPLQKIHFRENYLETRQFPKATFSGKIIEKIDMSEDGSFEVRAKGILEVHGVSKERILKGTIIKQKDGCRIESHFSIPLADHNIRIPKIVHQKIAEIIFVDMSIQMTLSE